MSGLRETADGISYCFWIIEREERTRRAAATAQPPVKRVPPRRGPVRRPPLRLARARHPLCRVVNSRVSRPWWSSCGGRGGRVGQRHYPPRSGGREAGRARRNLRLRRSYDEPSTIPAASAELAAAAASRGEGGAAADLGLIGGAEPATAHKITQLRQYRTDFL